MKNRKIILLVIGALFFSAIASASLLANADYSASSDPLVTLSYVQKTLVPQIEKQVTEKVLAAIGEKGALPSEEPKEDIDTTTPSVDLSGLKYTVIHLTKGQKLFANGENTESLEIILRAGEALSVSPFRDQGIADLTASTQLFDGDSLVKNNYCIIPRGQDGRGIEVISDEAYFLVRGVYEVE
jgi:hypothetical protein